MLQAETDTLKSEIDTLKAILSLSLVMTLALQVASKPIPYPKPGLKARLEEAQAATEKADAEVALIGDNAARPVTYVYV